MACTHETRHNSMRVWGSKKYSRVRTISIEFKRAAHSSQTCLCRELAGPVVIPRAASSSKTLPEAAHHPLIPVPCASRLPTLSCKRPRGKSAHPIGSCCAHATSIPVRRAARTSGPCLRDGGGYLHTVVRLGREDEAHDQPIQTQRLGEDEDQHHAHVQLGLLS